MRILYVFTSCLQVCSGFRCLGLVLFPLFPFPFSLFLELWLLLSFFLSFFLSLSLRGSQ